LHRRQFDGKLAKLGAGQFVAYCNSHPKLKKCRVGKVVTLSRQQNLIIVHRYRPLADGRLRVRWLPAFTIGGDEFLGEGDVPVKEHVKAEQIVSIIDLHDGVVSHAASRKLDNAGWRYDETELTLDELRREPDLAAFTNLEEWFVATKGVPIERSCNFGTPAELQKWIQDGFVDFVEIFCGDRGITFAVQKSGMIAAEGFDRKLVSYGKSWDIQDSYEQYLIYWMIAKGLKPYAVHIATPCLGSSMESGLDTMICIQVTQDICEHQAAQGYLASVEQPVGSEMFRLEEWRKSFGGSTDPKDGWEYLVGSGCRHNLVSPDAIDEGLPIEKGRFGCRIFHCNR